MKVIVLGYHNIGHACLGYLLRSGDEIVSVVTHRDNPSENIWFHSVAELAQSAGVPVHYAEDMDRSALIRFVETHNPDVVYSFYFRNMIPSAALRVPRLGAFNLHGSFLPKYRGRCPVNWVILNQEERTGVTLHYMVRRADAGDIVGQTEIPIAPRETARSLYDKMVPVASQLIEMYHPLIREGRAPRRPQDEAEATYFGGRRPEDGLIDWSASAEAVDALVRAVTHPYPGAFTYCEGEKLLIWETEVVPSLSPPMGPGEVRLDEAEGLLVGCGRGSVAVRRCQPEGESETTGAEFAQSHSSIAAVGRVGRMTR